MFPYPNLEGRHLAVDFPERIHQPVDAVGPAALLRRGPVVPVSLAFARSRRVTAAAAVHGSAVDHPCRRPRCWPFLRPHLQGCAPSRRRSAARV